MTAGDLINSTLRLIGVTASGETPSSSESADALVVLNDLIDSWSNEQLLIPAKIREEQALVALQESYTFGASGDWNSARPLRIENIIVKIDTNTELPLSTLNQDQYANIVDKSVTSEYPTKYFDLGGFPLRTIYFWPTPSEVKTMVIWSWKALATMAGLTTAFSLPPGYSRALRYNFAIDLAPEYGRSLDAAIVEVALTSKAAIKRLNIEDNLLGTDQALLRRGTYDWRVDE